MIDPQIVSRDEWLAARKRLLAKEKEFTRQRDELRGAPTWSTGPTTGST